MIMVASYVGTLVAFLTVEKNVLPFNTVEELYKLSSVKYGCKDEGSTKTFFQVRSIYKSSYRKCVLSFSHNILSGEKSGNNK